MVSLSYHEQLEKRFGKNIPEERLSRLAKLLSNEIVFPETKIYVDSFTSFTYDENQVLLELMKQANEVTITLCMDKISSQLSHFKSISEIKPTNLESVTKRCF